eukprot:3912353-Rhodomonas_salina.1
MTSRCRSVNLKEQSGLRRGARVTRSSKSELSASSSGSEADGRQGIARVGAMVLRLGSRVQGPGSRVQGPGSTVRVQGLGSRPRPLGPGPRAQGPRSRAQGLGQRV